MVMLWLMKQEYPTKSATVSRTGDGVVETEE